MPAPVAGRLARVPLPVLLAAMLVASMALPALHALTRGAPDEARAFLYSAILLLALVAALAVATLRDRPRHVTRSHLIALLVAYLVLPAMAAVPLWEIIPGAAFRDVYFEMIAAMTTTGGSLFDAERLGDSVHLWRAMVAWEGGLLIWVAAIAILAPLNLGGFEVAEGNTATGGTRDGGPDTGGIRDHAADPEVRVARAAAALAPVYLGLTLVLWGLLVFLGEEASTAMIHAMSTLSTSGITNGVGVGGTEAGFAGELVVAAFLLLALSRALFTTDMNRDRIRHLREDRELRVAGMIVGAVTLALFARHWVGALQNGDATDAGTLLRTLWGSAFTTLSYLTTTGFESPYWLAAREWSGLGAPSVLLLGLAIFGGGVATTAGGVKLLRIYTLYAQGRAEMHLLVHPHLVAGTTGAVRRIPPGGIEAAWVFFMLFATSIAAVTLALTAAGLDFEGALALGISCLTTTGPLAERVLGGPGAMAALSDPAKVIAALTMVLGRMEALALIALLNPDFWRD